MSYSYSRTSYTTRTTSGYGSKTSNYQTHYETQQSGHYYEDDDFPCCDNSIFFSRRPPRPFEWKRPWEICDDPQMSVGGASRLDIQQGMLGDCWLLAAISALTQFEPLMDHVVPKDYVADKKDPKYTGKCTFNIWQYGEWVEVTIDDRLPTYHNKLVFVHSATKNEFWSALLEKAYAKLNGSYEALKGGQTGEALEDFTGGLSQTCDLQKASSDLFAIMQKAMSRQALMGCSIAAKANEIEAKLNNGLIKGHAYTVTGVVKTNARTRGGNMEIELVRVRNPWGNDREWTGPWSDRSPEWSLLSDREKREIGLEFEDDGEFWMSYKDFIKYFTTLEICRLGEDSQLDNDKLAFNSMTEQGSWRRGISAGGCRNFIDSFHKNPQFRITLEDSDEDEDDMCTLIIALMQKDRRKEKSKGINMLTIGYSIYCLNDVDEKYHHGQLDRDFFQYHASTARSVFMNSREVCGLYSLPPGEYVIIPTTFKPNEEGNFLLRIFSEKSHKSCEIDEKTSFDKTLDQVCELTPDQHAAMEAKYKDFYDSLAGKDGEIDAWELQNMLSAGLKNGKKKIRDDGLNEGFINMFDDDRSGTLGFQEFKQALMIIKRWTKLCKAHDQDESGELDGYEIRELIKDEGVHLNRKICEAVCVRFSNEEAKISLVDFLQFMTRIYTLQKVFEQFSSGGSHAKFTLDEFMEMGVAL